MELPIVTNPEKSGILALGKWSRLDWRLANVCERTGDLTDKQTAMVFEQGIQDPREINRLQKKARHLAEDGKVAEALKYQRVVVELAPDDPEAFLQLGYLHQAASDIDAATVAFRRAIWLAPNAPEGHEALSEMFLDASLYDQAIAESKHVLRLTPNSLAARDILSTAYFQKGDIRKALEVTGEMVRMAPSDPLSHYKRGVLHQQRGDWRNALDAFQKAFAMAPEGSIEQVEAEQAIDALDRQQVRDILILATEDRIFQMQLSRNVEEATRERGYSLSDGAAAFIGQVALDKLAGTFQQHMPGFVAQQSRPQRYN